MSERSDEFVAYLHTLPRNALINVRASLNHRDGISPNAVRYVAPFLPAGSPHEEMWFLVAGLFADAATRNVPASGSPLRIGAALARFDSISGRAVKSNGMGLGEAQLDMLVRGDRETIAPRLVHVAHLLSDKGIALNWGALASDLTVSDELFPSRVRAWAYDFYRRPSKSL